MITVQDMGDALIYLGLAVSPGQYNMDDFMRDGLRGPVEPRSVILAMAKRLRDVEFRLEQTEAELVKLREAGQKP